MIVHIGFPNSASTTLQMLVAKHHPNFLGCNPKNRPGEFYHPLIGDFFENVFRMGSNTQFKREKGRIKAFLGQQDDGFLSNENIAFRLTPWDLPTDIKIERLGQLLPTDTKIVLIHRPVRDLLLTYYFKVCAGWGYTGEIDEFISEAMALKDYGWIADLDLENLYSNLREYYPDEQIIFSDLNDGAVFSKLFQQLGLDIPEEEINIENKSVADSHIPNILEYNRSRPGHKKLLDWLELHRTFPHADLPDSDKFYLARTRQDVTACLLGKEEKYFDRTAIQWPDYILQQEEKNRSFICSRSKNEQLSAVDFGG